MVLIIEIGSTIILMVLEAQGPTFFIALWASDFRQQIFPPNSPFIYGGSPPTSPAIKVQRGTPSKWHQWCANRGY